jgi:hypothetical protein
MQGMVVEPLTSFTTCIYQLLNQLTTLLNCDKTCETLLLTCSISYILRHSNFEVHFVLHVSRLLRYLGQLLR